MRLPIRNRIAAGALAVSLLLAPGCAADKDSTAAQLEKAAIAMDQGDYSVAESVLLALCPDLATCSDDILSLLGEARMGLGGVELTNLLDQLDPANRSSSSNQVFDAMNALFGTSAITAGDVASLQSAIDNLGSIGTPTTSDQTQLAVAAATHLVASVITLTSPDNGATFNSNLVTPALASVVTADLAILVNNATAVATTLGANDLTTDLNSLLVEIEGPNGDQVISAAELTAFVGALI